MTKSIKIKHKVANVFPYGDVIVPDIHSQKSPRAEKLDEMPDYETTNGVSITGIRIPTTAGNNSAHSDGYNPIQIMEKLKDEEVIYLALSKDPDNKVAEHGTLWLNYTRARIDQAIICFKMWLNNLKELEQEFPHDCKCKECKRFYNRISQLNKAIEMGEK